MSAKDQCPFCRKIRQGRDRHGKVTDEGAGVVSFEPLGPVAPGHRLFVPRVHATAAGHNPGAAASAFASAAAYAVKHGIREYNLIQSNGHAATQTVPHVHVHLVPRREGDGLALPWSPPLAESGLTEKEQS